MTIAEETDRFRLLPRKWSGRLGSRTAYEADMSGYSWDSSNSRLSTLVGGTPLSQCNAAIYQPCLVEHKVTR